jgi:hypothetical protein
VLSPRFDMNSYYSFVFGALGTCNPTTAQIVFVNSASNDVFVTAQSALIYLTSLQHCRAPLPVARRRELLAWSRGRSIHFVGHSIKAKHPMSINLQRGCKVAASHWGHAPPTPQAGQAQSQRRYWAGPRFARNTKAHPGGGGGG